MYFNYDASNNLNFGNLIVALTKLTNLKLQNQSNRGQWQKNARVLCVLALHVLTRCAEKIHKFFPWLKKLTCSINADNIHSLGQTHQHKSKSKDKRTGNNSPVITAASVVKTSGAALLGSTEPNQSPARRSEEGVRPGRGCGVRGGRKRLRRIPVVGAGLRGRTPWYRVINRKYMIITVNMKRK
jgi:hypothetical protein